MTAVTQSDNKWQYSHLYPSHSQSPSQWSTLIGRDPSRCCALIGWTLLCLCHVHAITTQERIYYSRSYVINYKDTAKAFWVPILCVFMAQELGSATPWTFIWICQTSSGPLCSVYPRRHRQCYDRLDWAGEKIKQTLSGPAKVQPRSSSSIIKPTQLTVYISPGSPG